MKQLTAPWTYLRNRLYLSLLKMHSPKKLDLPTLLMVLCSSLKYSATKIIPSIFNVLVWKPAQTVRSNGNELRTHATEAENRDTPYFVNNPLSSLFSECTLSLNGEKISTTNANFAHKSFIETEFSYGNDAKKTWLACQGYFYEENLSAIDGAGRRADDVTERKVLVAVSSELKLIGKMLAIFCRVTSIYLAVRQLDCLLDVLLTILLSYLKMQLNTTRSK